MMFAEALSPKDEKLNCPNRNARVSRFMPSVLSWLAYWNLVPMSTRNVPSMKYRDWLKPLVPKLSAS